MTDQWSVNYRREMPSSEPYLQPIPFQRVVFVDADALQGTGDLALHCDVCGRPSQKMTCDECYDAIERTYERLHDDCCFD